ncbi:lanosterol 14-alpha demethylase [Colletotrichum spaethianum]|uniref:Lanosterol 14-alpha demethylase n=1 Tax=Colletotrichum spaethianum TaxID=700344 RepID=A0AA37LAX8_9PEZI|nr:lanosterol 14-alpha demethylase [Colletotrichum spaethianum]GKT45107.1 lanosterol 14-alpha demethylase [Colletotrichum spaethianum]
MPENARSFCHGMFETPVEHLVLTHELKGAFLNKNMDPVYMENIRIMVGSFIQYMDRAEAQEHTVKCATEETHSCALEWTTRSDVELFTEVSELTHNVTVKTLMGDDFYESGSELLSLMHAMEHDIDNFWSLVLPDWVPHPSARRLHRARERVKEIFWERLSQRHVAAKNGDVKSDLPDYITYMLHDRSTAPLKHCFAAHHALLMFASDTSTAAVTSWVVVCLLRHPDVMAAVKRDARSGASDSVLLQACIKETMRYYNAMKYFRPASVEPKGSMSSVSLFLKHDDTANYPNSDTWMPGRWLNAENKLVDLAGREEESKPMILGGGNYLCPGEKMATIIVTQTLTTLLRYYDIIWATLEQPRTVRFDDLDFDKIGSPWLKGGLKVKVSRRVWPELMGGC